MKATATVSRGTAAKGYWQGVGGWRGLRYNWFAAAVSITTWDIAKSTLHAVHVAFSHRNWTDRGAYLLQAIQKQLRSCCGASICCRKSCQRQHQPQPQPQQHATTTTTTEKEKQKKTTPALWLAVCDLYRLQVAAHETNHMRPLPTPTPTPTLATNTTASATATPSPTRATKQSKQWMELQEGRFPLSPFFSCFKPFLLSLSPSFSLCRSPFVSLAALSLPLLFSIPYPFLSPPLFHFLP